MPSYLSETPTPRNKMNITEYYKQNRCILKVSVQIVMINFERP